MAYNFPNLKQIMTSRPKKLKETQAEETWRLHKGTYSIIKLLKTNDKKKILKTAKE